MSKICFSNKHMKDFLDDFDVTHMQYFGKNELPPLWNNKALEKYMEDVQPAGVNADKCSAAELSDAYEIAKKVYGSTEEAQTDAAIYGIVSEKFIGEFVGIEGLDTLYNPLFFTFEWLMHLEYNPKRNSYSYYRDHFIHQIRNMVEMLMLLTDDELHLKEQCIKAFKSGKSRMAVQMRRAVNEIKQNPAGIGELNAIADKIPYKGEKSVAREEYVENAIYTYILLASAVVTSAFHDIGYPVEFINRKLTEMDEFLPASQLFFEKKDATSKMHRILQDSLLYRTISLNKINKKICSGDHGAISACILLMKYYENGKIHSLPPVQKIIIELSAVTIFEHTLKYENIKTGDDKYQNSFEENPFSYLFRLCDDIEEWDRTYFEITEQSNFLLCEKCGAITKRIKSGYEDKLRHYACGCGDMGINQNKFYYRKLASVNTCKYGEMELYQDKIYRLELRYDLIALLQACAYSVTFAQKRAEALREIKIMTMRQSGLNPIYIDSFISNNPILIKTEILSRFFKEKSENWLDSLLEEVSILLEVTDKLKYIWNDSIYDDALVHIPFIETSKLYEVQKENVLFYMKLLMLTQVLDLEKDKVKEYFFLLFKDYLTVGSALKVLVEDCVKQRLSVVSVDDFVAKRLTFEEAYYDMYISPEKVKAAVGSYIHGPLYDRVRMRTQGRADKDVSHYHYDFYSDYGIFEKMHEFWVELQKEEDD